MDITRFGTASITSTRPGEVKIHALRYAKT